MGSDNSKEIKDCWLEIGYTFDSHSELAEVYECLECKARTTFPYMPCYNCEAIKNDLKEQSIKDDVKNDFPGEAW